MTNSLRSLGTDEVLAAALAAKEVADKAAADLKRYTDELGRRYADDRGRHTIANVGTFTVSANNSYDEAAIRAALTPGQVKRVSRLVLDKSVVKALYPDVHAGSKRENGVKISLA